MMRSLTFVAFGAALLAVVPGAALQAVAQEGAPISFAEAFDYAPDGVVGADSVVGVSSVSYLADCCEPTCEAPCECGDSACCGDEVGCGDCCGGGCGCAKKPAKKNPCATSHKGLFYANDFSYLNDPCYNGCCLGDCLKQMDVCGCDCGKGKLDFGGQLRLRYHHEEGMGRQAGVSGFNDTTNDFLLSRLRLYTNYKLNDWCRFYAEGILADAGANDEYIPRPIDRNYGDLLNLFVDVKLTDSTTVRVGRQELLYGNQRHISPLDWANTRRTFEGIRVLYKKDDWAVDGFYTNFVPVDADEFDEADYDRSFYGVYATYTGAKSASYDLFYIGFDDERAGSISSDFSIHTFGGRMFGSAGSWLYETEAAYQTGRQSGLGADHRAGMCTIGAGRKIDAPWTPTVWFYYDYASGNDMDGSTFNRYNQLFPLAHKYLGFIDAVARSNISSPNCLVTMKPTKKLSLLFWYYYFGAADEGDIIPGVAVPSNQNTTSDDFGNELDIVAKYGISPRSNILFGYSHLWKGSKIIGTDDASFFYTQWTLNF